MKKSISIFILIISSMLMFTACTDKTLNEDGDGAVYKVISAAECKKIIDEQDGYVILDVRTQEEFDEGHIEGAILVPDYDIATKIESVLTDKNQLILVYCRTGRRSALAAKEMISLGYTNVLDFGGIIDWPYETVK